MKNIYKNGKYEVKLEKEYNEHKILVDPENENNYVVLGNSKSGNEFYLYYVNDNVDSTVGGTFKSENEAIIQASKLRPTYIPHDQIVINNCKRMIKENNEDFFKNICKKYIDTMSKEMILETDNKKILHIFIEDEYIELKENGKINIHNYKDYLDENFEIYEYNSYKELYDSVVKDEVAYDLNNLELFDSNGEWTFYLSFEELRKMGYGNDNDEEMVNDYLNDLISEENSEGEER